MANKYIINVQDFSPHEITAGGSLAGKYIRNTPDFPRPTKVIVAEKVLNMRKLIYNDWRLYVPNSLLLPSERHGLVGLKQEVVIAGNSMANKYIINVQDFSPHEITAGGSLAGKYIINTPDFPRPTKVIVAEKVLNVAINTNACATDYTRISSEI
jgi:hypothetical protein